MTWKCSEESGTVWFNQKETVSNSGTRTDVIFGSLGIGSPHGHCVYFNNSLIYCRPHEGLVAQVSGTSIVVFSVLSEGGQKNGV